jgi:DNA-binding XRE family transcriptional regulator
MNRNMNTLKPTPRNPIKQPKTRTLGHALVTQHRAAPADVPAAFSEAFRTRTRQLRVATGMTQAQMAEALGIEFRTYQKYEQRSPLPHHLIVPFAKLVRCDVRHLLGAPALRNRKP